jgi:phosphoribosylpyrophosphate synthetase
MAITKAKLCLIIDDIIDTAGTLSEVAKFLLANGAKEVWVAATHGIFSGRAGELIKESGIKKTYISNTIESNQERAEILSDRARCRRLSSLEILAPLIDVTFAAIRTDEDGIRQ